MSDDQLLSDTPVTVDQTENIPPRANSELEPKVPTMMLMKPFPITLQIYQWQPMGIRVTLKLPIVSDDKSPLFAIKATPVILTPQMALAYYRFGPTAYRNLFPVKLAVINDTGLAYTVYPDDSAVVITQHSPPPLLTYIAMAHRFHRGAISHSLRTTSQFTNQAQVYVAKMPPQVERFTNFSGQAIPTGYLYAMSADMTLSLPSNYLDTYQGNSFINADLSVQRHIEFTMPFERPLPRHDCYIDDYTVFDTASSTISGFLNSGNYAQYSFIGLKAGIDKGSGPGEIFFELYIKVEPDFEFSGYKGYPRFITERDQTSFLDDYNMAIGKNPIIFPNSKVYNDSTTFTLTNPHP